MTQQPDSIDRISSITTKAGAVVATTPGLCKICGIEWWNENSAGVVALCAVVGAIVTVLSYVGGQWHKGNIQRLAARVVKCAKGIRASLNRIRNYIRRP